MIHTDGLDGISVGARSRRLKESISATVPREWVFSDFISTYTPARQIV